MRKYISVLGKSVKTFRDAEAILFASGYKKGKYAGIEHAYEKDDRAYTFFASDKTNYSLVMFA